METLLELQKDLQAELELMNEFAEENLKSYQVWQVTAFPKAEAIRLRLSYLRHHRLTLITHLQPELHGLRKEINFIHKSLMPDAKNYHTWAYLNWLYSHFSNLPEPQGGNRITDQAWADEVEWCNHMLDSNFKFRGSPTAGLNEEAQPESEGKIVPLDEETEEEGTVIARGDGRNNSAWSWRWHLMVARKGARPDPEAEREWVVSSRRGRYSY